MSLQEMNSSKQVSLLDDSVSVDDVRIACTEPVLPPSQLLLELPCTEELKKNVYGARKAIQDILEKKDDRLVVIIGPCSIHDPEAAREYASRLREMRQSLGSELEIIMRVYFEKPRTTVGWKGLINDPDLDGSFQIRKGLRLARQLLVEFNTMQVPAATEFLDVITPQYLADLIAWGAIGARTTESQIHRELASGLSCPVGFKNGTNGDLRIAFDAILSASRPHHFLSVTKSGLSAIVSTKGNPYTHVVLRGGKEPNHDPKSVLQASQEALEAGLPDRLMIDLSHGNSQKKAKNQVSGAETVAAQIAEGNKSIVGVMIEGHLNEGRQDLTVGGVLEYGKSITDACLGWSDSVNVLNVLAESVRLRRSKKE